MKMISSIAVLKMLFLFTNVSLEAKPKVAGIQEVFPGFEFLKLIGVKNAFESYPELIFHCSSTSNCIKSRDCCYDHLWKGSSNVSNHIQRVYNHPQVKKQSCLKYDPGYEDRFIMVDSCLPKTNQSQIEMCRLNKISPKYGTDDFLYKNVHCANCNNIFSFEMLSMTVDCLLHDDDSKDLFKSRCCRIEANFINYSKKRQIHRCKPQRCDNLKATFCGILQRL